MALLMTRSSREDVICCPSPPATVGPVALLRPCRSPKARCLSLFPACDRPRDHRGSELCPVPRCKPGGGPSGDAGKHQLVPAFKPAGTGKTGGEGRRMPRTARAQKFLTNGVPVRQAAGRAAIDPTGVPRFVERFLERELHPVAVPQRASATRRISDGRGDEHDRLPKTSPERMCGLLSASWLIHCR